MILGRTVFHTQHGTITQLVQKFKQVTHDDPELPMILTDLSEPMSNGAPNCSATGAFSRARPPWTI
jgi:hypothetical protein